MLQGYISRKVRIGLERAEHFDRELSGILRKHLRPGMVVGDDKFRELVAAIGVSRRASLQELNFTLRETVEDIAKAEHTKEWDLLAAALGLSGAAPKRPTKREVTEVPFSSGASSAATLSEWLTNLLAADMRKIKAALSLGVMQQMNADEVVAHVIGTRENSFRDGVVARTRNNIRALIATAIAHAAQVVRESLWVVIPGIIGMLWASTLDEKTSVICRGRDHAVVMFGEYLAPAGTHKLSPPGARPPAHPHCRSRMIALVKGEPLQRVKFSEWLTDKSPTVQNRILGHAKGELFRQGKVQLENFTDLSGRELTLSQLVAA